MSTLNIPEFEGDGKKGQTVFDVIVIPNPGGYLCN
jgi:hypothetical protein